MDYEKELQQALKLSQASYEEESRLRAEARKLHEAMKQKQKAEWSEYKQYASLVNFMQWQPLFVHRGVGAGLQNLGNSCFMNSVLQCLAYSAPFAQFLCQSKHSAQCKSTSFCSVCELERTIPSMLMSKDTVRPRRLFSHLASINDLLTPGCQEDAHEFLQSLLDKLEIAYDAQVRPYQARDAQNPIRRLFTGATKTSIQCARCKQISVTSEPFCCLSLEVDDKIGLYEALEIFTQHELMRGDDKYDCSVCQRRCIAHKRLTFAQLPAIMIVHLKRFTMKFDAYQATATATKLPSRVEFTDLFDLSLFSHVLHEDDRARELKAAGSAEYELYAVLVHSGPKLGYGHYYALIKAPDGNWYRMNDMDVIPVTLKHVLREQAYLLFYKRRSDTLMRAHLESIQTASSAAIEGFKEEKLKAAIAEVAQEKHLRVNDEDEMKKIENVDLKQAILASQGSNDNNDDDGGGGVKVETDLLTNDYFANHCQSAASPQLLSGSSHGGGGVNDRSQYVQVPPMAMRPAERTQRTAHATLVQPDDNNTLQEIFWPYNDDTIDID